MKTLRRMLVTLGFSVVIAGVIRLRGTGGTPPKRGGWRELPPDELA